LLTAVNDKVDSSLVHSLTDGNATMRVPLSICPLVDVCSLTGLFRLELTRKIHQSDPGTFRQTNVHLVPLFPHLVEPYNGQLDVVCATELRITTVICLLNCIMMSPLHRSRRWNLYLLAYVCGAHSPTFIAMPPQPVFLLALEATVDNTVTTGTGHGFTPGTLDS
jgi:hypothetical protein